MIKIIFTRPDGRVSITTPAERKIQGESDIDYLSRISSVILAANPTWTFRGFLDESEVPVDRTFRDAWRIIEDSITSDLDICKNIWRDKMRSARKPKLEALDVEYQRADEEADDIKKQEVVSKKILLRNITSLPEIDNATSEEELKSIWPSELE